MEYITLVELCVWLETDADSILRFRKCEPLNFPPPELGFQGLRWLKHDIVQWLGYLDERLEYSRNGLGADAVPAPQYLTSEPRDDMATVPACKERE